MKFIFLFFSSMWFLQACARQNETEHRHIEQPHGHELNLTFDETKRIAVAKLKTFCAACHAIAPLRFFPSDNEEEIWNFIHNEYVPNSQRLWISAISDVLAWPQDKIPTSLKDPVNNRDWMPKGIKREQIFEDRTNGESTRLWLLRVL